MTALRHIERGLYKMDKIIIRNESQNDYEAVENVTREAFWNVNTLGCSEHYLAHILRSHEDFVPRLDLVAEADGQIVGNVMFTQSKLKDGQGNEKKILTFGPISVLPQFQRRGISVLLLDAAFKRALELGYEVIVIFGNPDNYVSRGFKSCKKFNVCLEGNVFPAALLVKELKEGVLDGRRYYFYESPAYNFDQEAAEKFDKKFPHKEKRYMPSQEEFFIHSHSFIK